MKSKKIEVLLKKDLIKRLHSKIPIVIQLDEQPSKQGMSFGAIHHYDLIGDLMKNGGIKIWTKDPFPSEHLIFVIAEEKPKTKVWEVMSKTQNSILGKVKWHPAWRQYCFFPKAETLWSNGCLNDIVVFLNTKNHEHSFNLKKEKGKQ